MTRTPIFERMKEIDRELFSVTVWSDGTISILNHSDNCAIATANFKELYELIKSNQS